MDSVIQLFGRFHPLLVHMPIGIIVLAFVLDALSLWRKYRKLSVTVQPCLAFGTLSAILSVISGLIISDEGGYTKPLVLYHQYAGIATTVGLIALLIARRSRTILQAERQRRKPIRFFLFVPVMALLVLTGHWGGSLTHGEEFLTEVLVSGSNKKEDPISRIKQISNPDDAVLYSDVIQPILESKCYSCHSASKQKGDLRLDHPDFIRAGGKEGVIISHGVADSSSLYARMMLPLEHEDHMPPNEKPQPSTAEIDIIRLWINEGAPFDKKVSSLKESAAASQFITLITQAQEQEDWLPKAEVSAADPEVIEILKNTGVIVLPIGEENNYLEVSFTNARTVTPEIITLLEELNSQIVSMRLSHCQLTPNDLSFLNKFKNLTWLHLDHSNADDNSFGSIETLPNLKYLNIVFTTVSEISIDEKKFPSLKKLFTFNSGTRAESAATLHQRLPELKIDTGGFVLPRLQSDTIIYRKGTNGV